jgi:hypothetical protein
VLFRVRRPLSLLAWLAVPLLFAAAVLGLTGFGGVLLDAPWRATLSSALFGPAAAVTLVLAPSVAWNANWVRWTVGIAYPAVVFAAGIVLNDVSVPPTLAMILGAPALLTLVVMAVRDRTKVVPIA